MCRAIWRVPACRSGANPVILETDEELAEFEAFLSAERPEPVVPDIFATRPGALHTATISLFEYAPPEPGWPWLLVCHWPEDHAALAVGDPELLARGAYTIEIFLDRADLLVAVAILTEMRGGPEGFTIVKSADVPHGTA